MLFVLCIYIYSKNNLIPLSVTLTGKQCHLQTLVDMVFSLAVGLTGFPDTTF